MAANTFDDSEFNKLFPPNTIVHLHLEVARAKKIFQHEDNARVTSNFVELHFANSADVIGRGWIPSGETAIESEKELCKTPRKGKPTVTPSWNSETSANSLVLNETKTVQESSDPFFNNPFEFVFNPREEQQTHENEQGQKATSATFHFRCVDANYDPPRPICLAATSIPFFKNGKGEVTLNTILDPELAKAASATEPFERTSMKEVSPEIWPSTSSSSSSDADAAASSSSGGTIIIRWSVKLTKPKPPVRDPEADIELAVNPEKLSGDSTMVPTVQEGYGLHTVLPGLVLFTDPDFTLKLNKAMIKILGALYDEENASKSPKKGRSGGFGGSMMMGASTRGGGGNKSSGDDGSASGSDQIDKVIVNYWKCKRSHQVHTKVRLAAERCLRHEQVLSFTPEEEAEYKLWWKQQAATLEVGVTTPQLQNQSSALRLMYDKIWVMMVCGDDETESGSLWTPSFDQRTKLQYAAWGATQYAALQAAFIKLVLPTISDRAALEIGVEDFKADEVTQDMMASAAQQTGSSARGGGGGSNFAASTTNSNNLAASTTMGMSRSQKSKMSDKDLLMADFSDMCGPLEKLHAPSRGDNAYKIFMRQTSDFLHRWQATMTETEQIAMLKGAATVIQNTARPFGGFQTEKPKRARSGRRASRSRSRR